jgi:uncharacterized protein (TIGR02996 family)
MTHDEAFLQAVLANPNDDGVRLIYADFLEEHGQPERAEFIRLQCTLAKLPYADPRRPALQARELELLRLHQEAWLGPLRPLLTHWTFRRGFLDGVIVAARHLVDPEHFSPPGTVRLIKADLDGFDVPQRILELMPESLARENLLLPLGLRGRTLVLAMEHPEDGDTLDKVQFILNQEIKPVTAVSGQLIEAIERNYGQYQWESVDTDCFAEPPIGFEAEAADEGVSVSRLVSRLVALILAEATALNAAEVRIEPEPDRLQVYFLLGDRLVERDTPPRRLLNPIVARVRLLTGMSSEDVTEQRGRLRGVAHGRRFDCGVVIRPTPHGPSIVLTW